MASAKPKRGATEGVRYFYSEVPRSGFVWLSGDDPEGGPTRLLTNRHPIGLRYAAGRFDPLEKMGLFRDFAEVEPTEEGVLDFANRFGHLESDSKRRQMERLIPGTEDFRPDGTTWISVDLFRGETLEKWRDEILAMRRCIELWDAIKEDYPDLELLEGKIRWLGNDFQYRSHADNTEDRPTGDRYSRVFYEDPDAPGFTPPVGDVVSASRRFIQSEVNERLRGRVDSRLLWSLEKRRLDLSLVPSCLAGALWLQFAEAVARNVEYRRCAGCGEWFANTGRSDAEHCPGSSTCRGRAKRKRDKLVMS